MMDSEDGEPIKLTGEIVWDVFKDYLPQAGEGTTTLYQLSGGWTSEASEKSFYLPAYV